jgi:hypothetical protein
VPRAALAIVVTAIFLAPSSAAAQQRIGAEQRQADTPIRPLDDARLRAAGIRKVTSRHLVLYTDLPTDPEVDRLPAVFDQAVPQWAEYFGVGQAPAASARNGKMQIETWQVRGFLIKDRERFDTLGLMPPAGSDHFVNGISLGAQFWFFDQPTAYYRRHLLLHEGTHTFMASHLGGCGPGWFMEGTAELMATHRLDGETGRLTLRVMPQSREEVPMLGRIELIRIARDEKRILGLPAVMQIDNRRILENESYAWCWSTAVFLDSHPRYRERFRNLRRHVQDRRFNEIVRRDFEEDWSDLSSEWQAFIASLDHGFDFERMAIDFRAGDRLRSGTRQTITLQADRGWQSSRVRLDAGQKYRLTASGRYQIGEEVDQSGWRRPWPCEPGGVTIEYYAGRPLGTLLGAVVADRAAQAPLSTSGNGSQDAAKPQAGFANVIEVGLGTTVQAAADGTLYFRVNDSPGRLDDNRGTLTVVIERI